MFKSAYNGIDEELLDSISSDGLIEEVALAIVLLGMYTGGLRNGDEYRAREYPADPMFAKEYIDKLLEHLARVLYKITLEECISPVDEAQARELYTLLHTNVLRFQQKERALKKEFKI